MKNYKIKFILLLLIIHTLSTSGQIKLPKVFSDNMVLQQGKPIVIWGTASKNEKIQVSFSQQVISTTSDSLGKWKVKLKALKVSTIPKQLKICGNDTIILKNILVGEVWIASGQSNMDYPLDVRLTRYNAPKADYQPALDELAGKKNPLIRVLYVEKKLEHDLATKGWAETNDTVMKYIASAGYFFAKELAMNLNVPIGIISNAWSGTQVENWTPVWAYQQSPIYKNAASIPGFKIDTEHPGAMFESMLKPLIPYSIKGFLWYQGESNCLAHDSLRYTYKFKMMIESWRKLWDDEKLPIYFVQLAPFYYSKLKNNPYNQDTKLLPYTWEAQLKCLKIPLTGMVITTDLVTDLNNIHPGLKWEVGKRLSYWALAKDYQKKIAFSGPIYDKMKIKSDSIKLYFKYTGNKIISSDNKELTWFEIAGEDRKFYQASVIINNKMLIVSSENVKNPVAVRFAWDESAQPNFYNDDNLPASPFRTDKW